MHSLAGECLAADAGTIDAAAIDALVSAANATGHTGGNMSARRGAAGGGGKFKQRETLRQRPSEDESPVRALSPLSAKDGEEESSTEKLVGPDNTAHSFSAECAGVTVMRWRPKSAGLVLDHELPSSRANPAGVRLACILCVRMYACER